MKKALTGNLSHMILGGIIELPYLDNDGGIPYSPHPLKFNFPEPVDWIEIKISRVDHIRIIAALAVKSDSRLNWIWLQGGLPPGQSCHGSRCCECGTPDRILKIDSWRDEAGDFLTIRITFNRPVKNFQVSLDVLIDNHKESYGESWVEQNKLLEDVVTEFCCTH